MSPLSTQKPFRPLRGVFPGRGLHVALSYCPRRSYFPDHSSPRLALGFRYHFALAAVLLALVGVTGCGGASEASSGAGVVRFDLGRAPSPSILTDIAASALQSYGFPITNVSGDLIQTDWRIQDPSTAVTMMGAQRVRDRAEVFVRSRAERYYVGTARMTFEVLVDGRWQAATVSEATQEQYEQLQVNVRERLSRYMNQN